MRITKYEEPGLDPNLMNRNFELNSVSNTDPVSLGSADPDPGSPKWTPKMGKMKKSHV